MNARLIEKIMTDGSKVWDIEIWQGDYDSSHSIVLSGISEPKAVDFVKQLRTLMESKTVEHLTMEETLFNQPHC